MLIPNDTGHPYRFYKFLEYQHRVPPIDPATLLAYAEKESLGTEDAVLLCWLHSAVYCEVTAIFLFEELDWSNPKRLEVFWREHKRNLIFNSSRRYAKSLDWFVPILLDVYHKTGGNFADWIEGLGSYEAIRADVEAVRYTGRFASECFMEPLLWMSKQGVIPYSLEEPEQLDWKRGANETSGLLNVLYLDEEADEFDRTGKLRPGAENLLNQYFARLHVAIAKKYPRQVPVRSTPLRKLCSFRNLFKGRRYGGFHHDRQLENLRRYETAYPGNDLWKRIFKLRRQLFVPQLLGEIGGWEGIRKDRNRLWLMTGRTGVES